MLTTIGSDDERIDQLLQEFLAKRIAGEGINVSTFSAQYPPYEDRLRKLLPALLAMERCTSDGDRGRQFDATPQALGEYQLGGIIGRGGMGLVVEAYHKPLERRVALKLLSPWRARAPQARERFQNEARAIASLQHENLIPIFDVGSIDGYDYFAMQLIDGINGRELVDLLASADPQGNGKSPPFAAGTYCRTLEIRGRHLYAVGPRLTSCASCRGRASGCKTLEHLDRCPWQSLGV